MKLIGEGKITCDLGTCLVVVLNQDDRVVYANEPLCSKNHTSQSLIGKDFKKLSTLTKDDLLLTNQNIVNNLFDKVKVKWFIIIESGLKFLIEN